MSNSSTRIQELDRRLFHQCIALLPEQKNEQSACCILGIGKAPVVVAECNAFSEVSGNILIPQIRRCRASSFPIGVPGLEKEVISSTVHKDRDESALPYQQTRRLALVCLRLI